MSKADWTTLFDCPPAVLSNWEASLDSPAVETRHHPITLCGYGRRVIAHDRATTIAIRAVSETNKMREYELSLASILPPGLRRSPFSLVETQTLWSFSPFPGT